ncbi:MAG TPA: hypothetical protein VGL76_04765 [Gaiellaceae bacterium]
MIALTACGGAKTPAERVADCLNKKDFLVQPARLRVEGTAPDGIAFTLVARTGAIDDTGNPGKRKLSAGDRELIRSCLH